MYLQTPIFNKLDINKTILLSIIIHALLLINLQWDPVKVVSDPVIEIHLQQKKIKNKASKPNPPSIERPKSIEKPIPIEDTIPIKEIPLPLSAPIKQILEETPSEDLVEQKATNINPQLINDYSSKIRAHIEKYKRYPRMAIMRERTGEVMIQVGINSNGTLINSRVIRSSGWSILDKEALAMIQRSIPFPIPSKDLKNNTLQITIPISFSLR